MRIKIPKKRLAALGFNSSNDLKLVLPCVGATYAVPHASFPVKYVKDHWFRGQRVTKEEALAIRQFFLDKREAILDRCRSAEFLGERSKKEAYRFIEEFFEELENEKRVVRTFCHR